MPGSSPAAGGLTTSGSSVMLAGSIPMPASVIHSFFSMMWVTEPMKALPLNRLPSPFSSMIQPGTASAAP